MYLNMYDMIFVVESKERNHCIKLSPDVKHAVFKGPIHHNLAVNKATEI